MSDRFEKRAEEFLQSVLERKACAWCRNRSKKIYLSELCRSCYDIRSELRRLHKRIVEADAKYTKLQWMRSSNLFALDLDYMLAIEMAESAQILGRAQERLLQDASTLECEMEFRRLSRRFVKKDLFDHDAFLFESFSPVHRRYLMYLLGRPMQVFDSRNRRRMAYGGVMQKSREEVLAGRAWGTYRVEKDARAKATRKKKPKKRP